jgi:hypothetical protein
VQEFADNSRRMCARVCREFVYFEEKVAHTYLRFHAEIRAYVAQCVLIVSNINAENLCKSLRIIRGECVQEFAENSYTLRRKLRTLI